MNVQAEQVNPDSLNALGQELSARFGSRFTTSAAIYEHHHAIARVFAEAGSVFNLVGEAELFASICGVVASEGAGSVIDPWTAASFGPDVIVRPFAPTIPYEIGVFHSAERRPSMIVTDFLALIDDRLREVGSIPQRVRSAMKNEA